MEAAEVPSTHQRLSLHPWHQLQASRKWKQARSMTKPVQINPQVKTATVKFKESKELDIKSYQKDGRVKGRALIFSYENSKVETNSWTTIDRRMLDPTKKDIACPRAEEKPQQDSRRGEIMFWIKPHTHQRARRAQTKHYSHQDPGTPQETEPDLPLSVCLLWRHGSTVACCEDRDSGCSRPGRGGMWAPP